MFDAWLVMALEDINYVFDWRLDAEHKMARAGKVGMTDAAVQDFVNRFMPAYMHYCPALHKAGHGPQPRKVGAAAGGAGGEGDTPALLVRLNQQRLPTASTFV